MQRAYNIIFCIIKAKLIYDQLEYKIHILEHSLYTYDLNYQPIILRLNVSKTF